MTLRLRVGKKGYVILPKAIREAAGIEEGDELNVSLNDGITLTPEKRFKRDEFHKAAEKQRRAIFSLKDANAPKPGEASGFSLEDELD